MFERDLDGTEVGHPDRSREVRLINRGSVDEDGVLPDFESVAANSDDTLDQRGVGLRQTERFPNVADDGTKQTVAVSRFLQRGVKDNDVAAGRFTESKRELVDHDPITLKQGVETAVFEQVPSIDRILDSTDHDSGENPYYAPAKK